MQKAARLRQSHERSICMSSRRSREVQFCVTNNTCAFTFTLLQDDSYKSARSMFLERRDPSSRLGQAEAVVTKKSKRRAKGCDFHPSPRSHPPRSPSELAPQARAAEYADEKSDSIITSSSGTGTNRTRIYIAHSRNSCARTQYTSARSRTRTHPGRTRTRRRTYRTP